MNSEPSAAVPDPALSPVPAPASALDRIASVDALRGLVITLMIFVNDLAGVARAPSWLRHANAKADAMTLPDIVFPAFLFIAGVSIPLALSRAAALGQSRGELFWKVLVRTLALLTMGVAMVNMEEHEPWYRGLWGLLAYLAMLLAFAVVPRQAGPARATFRIGRIVGAVGLLALGLLYQTSEGKHLMLGPLFEATDHHWLRHSWWGILGLIGWAYLVASLVYLAFGRRREWLLGAAALLMLLFVADKSDFAARYASREWLAWALPVIRPLQAVFAWINSHVSFAESLGSLAAITTAGCCLGSILTPGSDVKAPAERLRWTGIFVGGLLVAAVLLDAVYGLNKIQATPAWCFLCSAITAGVWMLLYWLMDLRRIEGWSRAVRPAGANPLLAYVLHPILYAIAGFVNLPLDFYKSSQLPLTVNIFGSLLMAFLVVQLTGLIARAGYRMKV
jgi:predicted acyltransferase